VAAAGARKVKVLFATAINPVSYDHSRYRPLWPAYLAAYAEKHLGKGAVEFRYSRTDPVRDLDEFRPDLFAVSSITQNYSYALHYIREARDRGVPSIMGGMHISALPQSLPREADLGCVGEGEETFLEVLKAFREHGRLPISRMREIRGIVFRDEDEKLVITPDRPVIPSLDDIPHPDRSLIGYKKREYLFTARGCQYNCVFCTTSRYWGAIRYLSADKVVEEVGELVEHGVRTIRFNDDNFVGNRDRLREISQKIVARGYHRRARFSCWARSNNVTPETVASLKAMNMVAVVMGLESGSPGTLRYLKGNVTVEDNARAIELLKDAGIQASGDFIIGAPGESEKEIMQTCDFIRKSRIDFVLINVFSPLPGTPVWEEARKKGLVSDDMDWGKVAFEWFTDDDRTSLNLSDHLTHRQLYRLYRKCRRLAFRRNLMALSHTPWLNELPGVMARISREKLCSLLNRCKPRPARSRDATRRVAGEPLPTLRERLVRCLTLER
jgi:anaerobic magnesium-protoporphyrin IX monomethyl ester cyclase